MSLDHSTLTTDATCFKNIWRVVPRRFCGAAVQDRKQHDVEREGTRKVERERCGFGAQPSAAGMIAWVLTRCVGPAHVSLAIEGCDACHLKDRKACVPFYALSCDEVCCVVL